MIGSSGAVSFDRQPYLDKGEIGMDPVSLIVAALVAGAARAAGLHGADLGCQNGSADRQTLDRV